jgi:hypothetical protein
VERGDAINVHLTLDVTKQNDKTYSLPYPLSIFVSRRVSVPTVKEDVDLWSPRLSFLEMVFRERRPPLHGLINYIDTKAKCRHQKMTYKGTCGMCLPKFIDWRYSQSCWYFYPALWTVAPPTFSLVQLPPPPFPLSCVKVHVQHIQTVYGWRGWGGGGWVLLEPNSAGV